jgi:glycosyltransferase involved in cell wall biosynthesis
MFIQTSRWPVLKQYYFGFAHYEREVRTILKSSEVVFIHGLFYHSAAAVAGYCHAHDIPYIVVGHGSLDPYVFTYNSLRKRAWITAYRKWLFVDSAALLFSTKAEAEKARPWTGSSHVEVVHWPVDLVPDYDKDCARTEIRRRYDLSSKTRIALFCGRLDPMKRPIETVREFKATAAQDWTLLLVGPLSDRLPREAVDAACREPGPRCIWIGPAYGEDLANHFRAADLFISWSHRENFSHVVAEALACGVPVFISRGVDLWHDLAPAGCAFIAPEEGEDPVHEALSQVLSMNDADLTAAGHRGRAWARSELSPEQFGRRLKAICETATSSHTAEAGCVRPWH